MSIEIKPGTMFDTEFEIGCVAIESPDVCGVFDARDSDGNVYPFTTNMVIGHPDHLGLDNERAT